MQIFNLKNMKSGWFVGDFSPVVLKSKDFEVACKYYTKGQTARSHVHKVSREITLIVYGSVKMCGVILRGGDIISLEPGEVADFEALEDSATLVVKTPSVPGDKYFI